MSKSINIGIDLGTTNSLIARAINGKVEVFKNPVGHKETLPSCVAFRNGRIIVGEKARELIAKDPSNVFQAYKRKMGTDQKYFVEATASFVSPAELSSYTLKELKNFVYSGEPVDAAVITIPASFDTLQSNATKEAGYQAGIKEVLLLQEPIAASLAFVNSQSVGTKLQGTWLVYDLGGGTFDAALVEVGDEMRVLDHQGNNYLGGLDFDNLIIEHLIVPHFEAKTGYTDTLRQMQTGGSKLNKLYYVLLHKAEEAKKELSVAETAEIEFDYESQSGTIETEYLVISRTQFENLVRDKVAQSIQLIKNLLQVNQREAAAIQEILLVGGSTYIPLVKRMLEEETGIKVNNTIDPTTAIAVGAAYFASSKIASTLNTDTPAATSSHITNSPFNVKHIYNKHCSHTEEVYVANISGPVEDCFYRIIRNDGAFDSGMLPLKAKISALLPLLSSHTNLFTLKFYNQAGDVVYTYPEPIEINQGTYSIYGQTLPNDICLEVDKININKTGLELVFSKNALLPLKKVIAKTLSKSVTKGSADSIVISMYEGNRFSKPSSCVLLGYLRITGDMLTESLYRGSDLEMTFEISESRDIKVTAYSINTDQQFTNVFSPTQRSVNRAKLMTELTELKQRSQAELKIVLNNEDYTNADFLKQHDTELGRMVAELSRAPEGDVTDTIFQIEERKRFYSQLFDEQNNVEYAESMKGDYIEYKAYCESLINERGTPKHKQQMSKIIADEKFFLTSTSSLQFITGILSDLNRIVNEIRSNDIDYIINRFMNLRNFDESCYKDYGRAEKLFITGDKAFEERSYLELKAINQSLINLLTDDMLIKDDYSNTGLK